MSIPLLRITNGFPHMAEDKLIARATAIHAAISSKTSLFPTPNPSMASLLDAINEFSAAVAALKEGGTRSQVTDKNVLKSNLVDLLHLLSYYVLYTAQGNRSIALQSGFSIAKEPTPVVLVTPTDLQVKVGEQKGWFNVSVKRQKGPNTYVYQYTTDPEQKEESWMPESCTKSKCIIKGLTPGLLYFVRVTIVGPNNQQFTSDVSSRVAS